MKRLTLIISAILLVLNVHGQNISWFSYNNSETPFSGQIIVSLASDNAGNIYTISKVKSETVVIKGETVTINYRNGGTNYMLTKTDGNGDNIWNRVITYKASSPAFRIHADNNQVYLIDGGVKPNDSLNIIVSVNGSQDSNIITSTDWWYHTNVLTFNKDGYFLWHKDLFGEIRTNTDSKLTEDRLVLNLFETTSTITAISKEGNTISQNLPINKEYSSFQPLKNSSSIALGNYFDADITKYDYKGTLLKTFSTIIGTFKFHPSTMDIDDNNNIYVAGYVAIDGEYDNKYYEPNSGVLVKLDSNLNFQWVLKFKKIDPETNEIQGLGLRLKVIGEIAYLTTQYDKKPRQLIVGERFNVTATAHLTAISSEGKPISVIDINPTLTNFTIYEGGGEKLYFSATPQDKAYINNLNRELSAGVNTLFGEIKNRYNFIQGLVFIDNNKDNIFNVDDRGIKDINIVAGNSLNSSNKDGYYVISSVNTGLHTVKTATPKYYTASPVSKDISFDGYFNEERVDFALQPEGTVNDLSVIITPLSARVRAGREMNYRITIKNNGNTSLSPTINFMYDAKMVFSSASPKETTIKENKITWQPGTVLPFQTMNYTIKFMVKEPPKADRGDTLCNAVEIVPIDGLPIEETDSIPGDNKDTVYDIITGAYDPNIKEVNKPEIINVNDVNGSFAIDYTIHFQNTGNDTAFHIFLIDSLDNDLKVESIEVLSASHDYEMSISENNVLRWDYYNIQLVDSNTNEPESHGFIKYRVWTKDNPALGDEFTNFADIYFDFNAPVRTNTTTNRIDKKESVQLIKGSTVIVYPNPTTDVFTIKVDIAAGTKTTVEVIDLTGKVIYTDNAQATTNGLETKIDINSLPHGIYFIKVYVGNEVYTAKVIKQ